MTVKSSLHLRLVKLLVFLLKFVFATSAVHLLFRLLLWVFFFVWIAELAKTQVDFHHFAETLHKLIYSFLVRDQEVTATRVMKILEAPIVVVL